MRKVFFKCNLLLLIVLSLILLNPLTEVHAQSPTVSSQPSADKKEFSGTGKTASEKFELLSGLAIFNMTHTGGSNFAIKLLDDKGNLVYLLVNEIGSFDGAKAIGVKKSGTYIMDIEANGKWTVNVTQSTPSDAPSIPKEFSGTGQKVSEFFSAGEGLATFDMTHDGSSNFAVKLMDINGDTVDLLANEIGSFKGSKAARIPNTGIYVLDITADGSWTINIKGEVAKKEDIKPKNESGSTKSKGCFIATAAYGTPTAKDIDTLRDFRDEVLVKNTLGEQFVENYYKYSPPVADYIADKPIIRTIIRELGIKPLVRTLDLLHVVWGEKN